MDAARVAALRELLGSTGWVDRTRSFAMVMRRSTTTAGGLLLVGTPEAEPWHLAAHLDDESRFSGIAELSPTLVRWNAPADAPPHLRVTLERLEEARRGETVFVVAEEAAPERLLDRVSDARKHGATVLSLDGGDKDLEGLAHESLTVVQNDLLLPEPLTMRRMQVSRRRNSRVKCCGWPSRIVPARAPPIAPGTAAISKIDSPNFLHRIVARTAHTSRPRPTAGKARRTIAIS